MEFIQALARTKSSKRRKRLLKHADHHQALAIAEICANIVRSRFPLTTLQKRRLLPYADIVRIFSRKRSEREMYRAMRQSWSEAGLFPALLTPILRALTPRLPRIKDDAQSIKQTSNEISTSYRKQTEASPIFRKHLYSHDDYEEDTEDHSSISDSKEAGISTNFV